MKYIIAIIIAILLFTFYGLFFNHKLYCKVAMFDGIGNVPAFCLRDAINELRLK